MDAGCVGIPGAFNGMVARLAARAGFDALYVSGAAISAARGVPDVGILSLPEFSDAVRQVADASGLPVLADADTGFGESEMVTRAVHEYARAGAAGFHIEDQVFPKRCGHLEGKSLVGVDHFCEKIAAACAARDGLGGTFVVCARTDAIGVSGMDEAMARARAYLDAGADMIFPEGVGTEADFGRIAETLRAHKARCYVLANMTEFGKTPTISLARFAQLGYSAVIWPVTTFRAAMGEVTRALADLKRDGHAESFLSRVQTRKDLYAALGYTPGEEWRFPGPTSG